ncbi:MAG: beta-propeller fold lactonase family protein, partial [bacterium]
IHVGGIGSSLNTPHYVKISPDNKYFYISLIGAGYLQKYDVNTYAQVSGNMQSGQSPAHIVISPDDSIGYVTNFSSDHLLCGITSFNTSTMTVRGTLTDQKMPGTHGLALSNDGHYLYSTSQVGEYIFKINTNYFTNTDSLIKSPIDPSVPPSGNGTGSFKPYQCALSPDNTLLFVTCTAANQVRVYNTSDLSQVNSISVGLNPLILKFSNDGRYVFVCNRNDNTVSVINASTQTVQATITGVGIQPHSVDFSADGQYAIIACETQSGFDGHHPTVGSIKPGSSRIIQISNLTLLTNRMEMASFPAGIEIIK